jgi:tetratricopeptide (TPR) repeat protein
LAAGQRVPSILERGVRAAEHGLIAEGLAQIREACAADPDDPEPQAQLARWLSRLNRDDEALVAVARALALVPQSALCWDTVGVVLSRAGRHEQAVACFGRAVALQPGRAALHFNHAASLKFLGRFAEAESAYEACLQLDPHCWRAHSALAATRRQTPAHNHVDRLQRLLAAPLPDADAELHLRHALAKELEDLGREDEAFGHLHAGNARKFAATGYDGARDQRLFEAVMRALPEPLPASQDQSDSAGDDAPIFVVGLPRTGTTLVERILATHPRVASAGESQNFAVLLKRASGTRSPQVLDEETLAHSARIDLPALGHEYLRRTRPAAPARPRFVDKMPLNFFYLGHIARALPHASLVVVRRHPLDAGLSNFRQLFASGFSYYDYARDLRAIGRYYAHFDRLIRHWRKVLPGRVHEVHYEALVQDQRATTAALLGHCRLPWDEACLAFERNAAAVATASAVQVRQPLYASSVGRWRRLQSRLGPLIEELSAAGIELPGVATGSTPV